MHNMKFKFYALVCITIILQSCKGYYIPNENSTPMLSREKQTILNVGASFGMGARSAAGTIAFAPVNNIGLVYQGSNYTNSSNINSKKGSYHEFSFGYFNLIKNNVLFEAYINHGFGKSKNTYSEVLSIQNSIDNYNIKFDKTTFSFALGKVNKSACFSFYTRVGMLDLNTVNYENIYYTSLLRDLNSIKSKRYFTLIEPGLSARIGYENFKFYTKGSFSFIERNYPTIENQRFQLTFGIQIEFN